MAHAPAAEAQAVPDPVPLQGTRLHELHSAVLGRGFYVHVALPPYYGQDEREYPVVYLLDSWAFFGLYFQTYRMLNQWGREVEDVVLVGVGYRDENENGRFRSLDFTPTHLTVDQIAAKHGEAVAANTTASGGAGAFLRFLKEELIPFVEARYQVRDDARGLFGFSYGGLFATYALLEDSSVFRKYLIASPALWWDDGIVLRRMEGASEGTSLQGSVYVTCGETEVEQLEGCASLHRRLRKRPWRSMDVRLGVFDGESHNSVLPRAVSNAFRVLYPASPPSGEREAPERRRLSSAEATAYLAEPEMLVDSFARAWNNHDAAAFGALFSDDARWVTVSGTRLKGRAEIESFIGGEHATWARATSVTNTDVDVQPIGPDLAVVFFRWEMVGAIADDGSVADPVRGGTMIVAARRADRWVVVAGQVGTEPPA